MYSQFSSVAQSCLTLCDPNKISCLWVFSLTWFPQLVALVPQCSHYMTPSWFAMPPSLSPSCEYDKFCSPKPLSFLFLEPYPTNDLTKNAKHAQMVSQNVHLLHPVTQQVKTDTGMESVPSLLETISE